MPKAGPASVEFRNVSMRYGAVTAVDNVSFSIEAGMRPAAASAISTARASEDFFSDIMRSATTSSRACQPSSPTGTTSCSPTYPMMPPMLGVSYSGPRRRRAHPALFS